VTSGGTIHGSDQRIAGKYLINKKAGRRKDATPRWNGKS
jgi:hypothetical protein